MDSQFLFFPKGSLAELKSRMAIRQPRFETLNQKRMTVDTKMWSKQYEKDLSKNCGLIIK
jgi:hypothetical protein